MKKYLKYIALPILVLIILSGYQNCSKSGFSENKQVDADAIVATDNNFESEIEKIAPNLLKVGYGFISDVSMDKNLAIIISSALEYNGGSAIKKVFEFDIKNKTLKEILTNFNYTGYKVYYSYLDNSKILFYNYDDNLKQHLILEVNKLTNETVSRIDDVGSIVKRSPNKRYALTSNAKIIDLKNKKVFETNSEIENFYFHLVQDQFDIVITQNEPEILVIEGDNEDLFFVYSNEFKEIKYYSTQTQRAEVLFKSQTYSTPIYAKAILNNRIYFITKGSLVNSYFPSNTFYEMLYSIDFKTKKIELISKKSEHNPFLSDVIFDHATEKKVYFKSENKEYYVDAEGVLNNAF